MQVQYTDVGRQFIVQYFMADDTISVFEPPVRNSGILGGKFLERGIKYKYGTEVSFSLVFFGTSAHHGLVNAQLQAHFRAPCLELHEASRSQTQRFFCISFPFQNVD